MNNNYKDMTKETGQMSGGTKAGIAFIVITLVIAVICMLTGLFTCAIIAIIQAFLIFFGTRKALSTEPGKANDKSPVFYVIAAALMPVFIAICTVTLVESGFDFGDDRESNPQRGYETVHTDLGWPDTELLEGIERPDSENGYVKDYQVEEDQEYLDYEYAEVSMYGITMDEASSYIKSLSEELEKIGTVESDLISLIGELQDGRIVSITYSFWSGEKSELLIHVEKALPLPELDDWASHGVGALIPDPREVFKEATVYGRIESEGSDYFDCVFSVDSEKALRTYAYACMDAGFDNDYSLMEYYFSGKNDNGNYVVISLDESGRFMVFVESEKKY